MAASDIELLRRAWEAFARGDLDAATAALDSNVRWYGAEDPTPRPAATTAATRSRFIERDLHDGAQQRLVSASLALASAMRALDRGEPDELPALLARVREELDGGLAELRDLARGIHPAVLSDHGLRPALDALAARCRLPVDVHGDIGKRPVPAVESALYFTVAEALTNVAKYAEASEAVVTITSGEHYAEVEIADDGLGGADPANGSGLRGLVDRLGALGGHLHVDSRAGAGTRVHAVVPLSPQQAEADVSCGCCAEGQCRCSA